MRKINVPSNWAKYRMSVDDIARFGEFGLRQRKKITAGGYMNYDTAEQDGESIWQLYDAAENCVTLTMRYNSNVFRVVGEHAQDILEDIEYILQCYFDAETKCVCVGRRRSDGKRVYEIHIFYKSNEFIEGSTFSIEVDGQREECEVLMTDVDSNTGYDELHNVSLVCKSKSGKLVWVKYLASVPYGSELSPLDASLFREFHYKTKIKVAAAPLKDIK